MPDRRKVLQHIAATAAVAAAWKRSAAQAADRSALRVLILGGTGAIGPYHVHAAVARGHRVAVFSRGKRQAGLLRGVERLVGDRNGDLEAIRNREWDAVIDIATYGPAWVRSLGGRLRGRAKHYTFISSVSVYEDPSANAPTTEDAPVLSYKGTEDPYTVVDHSAHYGALKALCEQEARRQFPGRTLILRPGYIGGPGDKRALTYWAVRADKGGDMLAGGSEAAPVQYIDVRDLAEWAIRLIEDQVTGTYNAVGPASPLTVGQLVESARTTLAPRATITWTPAQWLLGQNDPERWGMLLFWSHNVGDIMRMSNARALRNGFTSRPLSVTLRETLDWYKQQPPDEQNSLITGFKRGPDGSWSPATTSWTAYLQREQELLQMWRAAGDPRP